MRTLVSHLAIVLPAMLLAAALTGSVSARADVYLDLGGAGSGIAARALGLEAVGQPKFIEFNGVPARVEIFRTRLPHTALADSIEAALTEQHRQALAQGGVEARGDETFLLPVRTSGAGYDMVVVATAPAPKPGAGAGGIAPSARAVSYHASQVEGGTELVVTHYGGLPLLVGEVAEDGGDDWSLAGETPVMSLVAVGSRTIAFEGRWELNARVTQRRRMLANAGYAVSAAADEGGIFLSGAGEKADVQVYVSEQEPGLVTEVITLVGR